MAKFYGMIFILNLIFNHKTMNFPTQKGQKYYWSDKLYTVRAFFGATGVEFDTFEEAKKANPKDEFICISSSEYPKGAMAHTECWAKQ